VSVEKPTLEWIVAAALLVLSLLPVAAGIGRARPRLRRYAWLVPATALLALVAVGLRRPAEPIPEPRVTERPAEVQSEGYATSRTCEACHPDQYASWYGSYHRTMTQVASPESIRAGPESWRFVLGRHNYTVTRRDGGLWVGSDDPAWARADPLPADEHTRPFIERPIVLVTGSHHEQVYWMPFRERTLAMFPILYRIDEARWVPYNGLFLTEKKTPPEFTGRRWNLICMRCHTTNPRPGSHGSLGMDSQVSEWGIACEACHGPGLEHVEVNRNPGRRYRLHLGGGEDPTIVNPERLPARRSAEVCGGCHGVHVARTREEAQVALRDGPPFRPGDDLASKLHVVRLPESPLPDWIRDTVPHFYEDRFWPDGEPSVSGREYSGVSMSPCYAGGEFSCLSCHTLHKPADDPRPLREWANDQLTAGMDGDAACLQCHESYAEDLAAHTHHSAESSGSRCYNCHMPNTEYGLLKATRSHRVDSPTARETLEVGRPNACNLCHLDRPLAWTAQHLERWYGIAAPELTDPEHERTADAVLMLLRGDAGQRALVAWHMGWEPAREASREDWIAPLLAQLIEDPYVAVRSIAYRSLRKLPELEDLDLEVFEDDLDRRAAKWEIWAAWQRGRSDASRSRSSEILMRENGGLEVSRLDALLMQRDDRRVYRAE
jgi:hypothetical protein